MKAGGSKTKKNAPQVDKPPPNLDDFLYNSIFLGSDGEPSKIIKYYMFWGSFFIHSPEVIDSGGLVIMEWIRAAAIEFVDEDFISSEIEKEIQCHLAGNCLKIFRYPRELYLKLVSAYKISRASQEQIKQYNDSLMIFYHALDESVRTGFLPLKQSKKWVLPKDVQVFYLTLIGLLHQSESAHCSSRVIVDDSQMVMDLPPQQAVNESNETIGAPPIDSVENPTDQMIMSFYPSLPKVGSLASFVNLKVYYQKICYEWSLAELNKYYKLRDEGDKDQAWKMIDNYITAHLTPMLPGRDNIVDGGEAAYITKFFELVKNSPMLSLPLDSLHLAVTRIMQVEERFESLLASRSAGVRAPEVPNVAARPVGAAQQPANNPPRSRVIYPPLQF